MGTKVNESVVKTALNTAEVRTVLEQKGLKISTASLFEVQADGSVKVDIEGDGIYDKVVTGLVSKHGNVNTKAKKIKVADTEVSTAVVDSKNKEIAEKEAKIAELEKKADAKFDTKKETAAAEMSYAKELGELMAAQATIENALKKKQKEDVSEMTKEEYNAYKKDLDVYRKGLQESKAKIKKFEEAKDTYIANQVKIKEAEHNENIETAKRDLAVANKELEKARTSYNDFLKENGYETKEDRKNVKAKKIDKKGTAFGEAKNKNAIVEQTVRNFVSTHKQLADNVGSDYRIEVKGATVSIKAGGQDGDERADFTISGLFDEKTGELSVDEKNIRYFENTNSTASVKLKVAEYKEALAKFAQLDSNIKAKDIDTLKQELKSMGVSDEEMQQ